MATFVIRGATTNMMDDLERAVDDAVNVVKAVVRVRTRCHQRHAHTSMRSNRHTGLVACLLFVCCRRSRALWRAPVRPRLSWRCAWRLLVRCVPCSVCLVRDDRPYIRLMHA